jgi:uncharacterized protein YcbX/ribosomal protein S18 acetylase RimI-like enzyme
MAAGIGSSMSIEIGHVEALFRYPVKSMGGERLEVAELGWHGLAGDRRLAFRRLDDRSGFPWLSASRLPELLLFAPYRSEEGAQGDLPTHVRTPDGEQMSVFGEDLAREVGRRNGGPVQMMQLRHGMFDEASISVIASETVREIGRLAGRSADVRHFRPNVVVRLLRSVPFQENEWVGGVLAFGDGAEAPAITVTMRDVRCSMVNLDPDSAGSAPEMLKAVVRANQNNAGVYGAVTRIGRLAVGQSVVLHAALEKGSHHDRRTILHVQLASAGDAGPIAAVLLAAFRDFEPLYTPAGFRATTPPAEEILQRFAEGPTWIALENQDVVGTVSAVARRDDVYVRSMAVLPSARGRGIATHLLDVVKAYAVSRSARRLWLTTTPFLTGAIRLYERSGFNRTAAPVDLHGTPLFEMVKELEDGSVQQ